MAQFWQAVSAFFAMLFTLFSAGEKFAKAVDNLGTVAEQASGEYADQSTIQRNMRLAQRKRDQELQAQALLTQTAPSTISTISITS